MDEVRRIADAVLYEGYILWPYRKSATKNQQRWTFGGVYPRAHSEGRDDDPWQLRTECLLEAPAHARVTVAVRFLEVVERQVRELAGGVGRPVDELTVAGRRHLSWDEAAEREVTARDLLLGDLEAGHRVEIAIDPGSTSEELREPNGRLTGEVVRSWAELRGTIEISARRLAPQLFRLTVRIANESQFEPGSRPAALRQTFCSTHVVLHVPDGGFVSLTDPPAARRGEAERCRNEGAWPVLVGEPPDRSTMLSAPIILEDYPRVAPESPGDLFDGSEIDELLVLSILSMTDEERAETRDTDPRAREILERTEALTDEQRMRLHGAIRELGMAR